MNVNDVGTTSVDVNGVDTNFVDVIVTDALALMKSCTEQVIPTRKKQLDTQLARCQGNEIEQWKDITRSLRIAFIIKGLTGLNSSQFEFDYLYS